MLKNVIQNIFVIYGTLTTRTTTNKNEFENICVRIFHAVYIIDNLNFIFEKF